MECEEACRSAAQQNHAKRDRIRRWLDAGRVVLLQETHWSLADSSVWSHLFPAAAVRASVAPGGVGGVAIIVPSGISITSELEVVPGYALAATLSDGCNQIRCVSMYLPPGHRAGILPRMQRALPASPIPTAFAGDVNLQYAAPARGEEELVWDLI